MEDIKKLLVQLMEGQEEIKIRLGSVEKTVLNIEADHGKKIKALLDGYKHNSEQLNRIENEVSRHEEVIIRRVK